MASDPIKEAAESITQVAAMGIDFAPTGYTVETFRMMVEEGLRPLLARLEAAEEMAEAAGAVVNAALVSEDKTIFQPDTACIVPLALLRALEAALARWREAKEGRCES